LKKKRPYNPLQDLDEDHETIGFDISDNFYPGPTIELVNYNTSANALPVHHGLGGGMDYVMSANIKEPPATTYQGHTRNDSYTDPVLREQLQRTADKQMAIVVVEEPGFDLSVFDGGDTQSMGTGSIYEGNTGGSSTEKNKSYFFPDDPEKPSWRPISMSWFYISILVVIALGLGALQEVLCQYSLRHPDTGLLQFSRADEISTTAYFTWKYLPTMVLVTYGVMWQVVDYEVKRLEPYYQLSKPGGASARDSLNLDYLTALAYFIPLRAATYKQWAVVFCSTATLIAGSLLAVLQSAAVVMLPKRPKGDELKTVTVSPIFSRLLSVSLLIIALLGIALIIALRRKSGLLSDPKGVAGIAAMATKSHILTDFKGLDTATNSVIHAKLRKRRYILHKSSLWQGEVIRSTEKHTPPDKHENPHPIMLRWYAGVPYILYIAALAAAIPVFIFVPKANVITDKVPFLLTALATLIKLIWSTLDITIRVMEPYWILVRRRAPPKTLTLDYTGMVPGLLSVRAAINRHWIVFFVATGAILSEILTICVTSFTVDGRKFIAGSGGGGGPSGGNGTSDSSETIKSFLISFGLSIGILMYLMIVAIVVYWKRSHVFLPRQPGSISSVLGYIHSSRMLVEDFIDTEKFNSSKMTKHLETVGKSYALGWFPGKDGKEHCGVDKEPIDAPYKYGVEHVDSHVRDLDVDWTVL
jgi:hypothetical protein